MAGPRMPTLQEKIKPNCLTCKYSSLTEEEMVILKLIPDHLIDHYCYRPQFSYYNYDHDYKGYDWMIEPCDYYKNLA